MNLRELTPEESAVLDAIIKQRLDNEGDIFKYDHERARDYLDKKGISEKYCITTMDQRRIVANLMIDHVIDVDYIMSKVFINNYRSAMDPNYIPDESSPKLYWANHTDWAYSICQLNGLISIEEAYENDGGALFIRMTKDDILKLRACNKKQMVFIKLDKYELSLSIKFGRDGSYKVVSHLKDDKLPFKVLGYAYNHFGKTITRKELLAAGIDVSGKSLKTQVFSDNKNVQALSPWFIKLTADSITFNKQATLTPNELKTLKRSLKI